MPLYDCEFNFESRQVFAAEFFSQAFNDNITQNC